MSQGKSMVELREELADSVEQSREMLRAVTEQDRREAGADVAGLARSIELGEASLAKVDTIAKACEAMLNLNPGTDCPPEVKELVRDAQALFRVMHDELTNPNPTLLDELTRANVPK
jgi:hypothetical protein